MPDRPHNVTGDFIFGTLATDGLRVNSLQQALRGLHHGSRTDPVDPRPGQPIRLIVTAGIDLSLQSLSARIRTDSGGEQIVTGERIDVRWETMVWGYVERWEIVLPPQTSGVLVSYTIVGRTIDEREIWANVDHDTGEPLTFTVAIDEETVPDWVRHAVIYQVFVDRFAPSPDADWLTPDRLDGIWGGTIAGLRTRVPYLRDLGVTCLWLSPVFPSPTHHGYDATDYTSIEPRLGTLDDFFLLIADVHDAGMRIILDFVPNHVSDQHPAFQRASGNPASPQRDWFTFTTSGYRSFFDVSSMPQLAVDRPGARTYLLDAAEFWLRRGVDGFRLDYANGPSHAFWAAFRQRTREVAAESFTVGEVVESADLVASYAGRMDGCLDFLLLQQIRSFLAFDVTTPGEFFSFLQHHFMWMPRDFVLPSFLDNHDMNRFLWIVKGDKRRLKMAAFLQFFLPHPPIIYYGTEVGLSQWHDLEHPDGSRRMEESRTPMLWDDQQDRELLDFYRRLIRIRRCSATNPSRTLAPIVVAEAGLLVIENADGRVLALNRTESPSSVALLGKSLLIATDTNVTMVADRLDLPPMSGAILERQFSP